MGGFDWFAELGPLLAPGLEQGEVLLAAFAVNLTAGTDQVADAERQQRIRGAATTLFPSTAEPHKPQGLGGRLADGVLDIASNTSPVNIPVPDLPNPSGLSLSGGAESQAVWLRDQFGASKKHALAVTNARAILVRDDYDTLQRTKARNAGGPPLPVVVVATIARSQLTEVRYAPKLLLRGRVELGFVDGSMLAISALISPRAKELVAALSG